MPTDWKSRKAELKKLYMEQDKSLEEVRKLLLERDGFNAS